MSLKSFWNNPENNSLKLLMIVAGIGLAGVFAFTFAHVNPFSLLGRVINGPEYGYGTPTPPVVYYQTNVPGCTSPISGASSTTGASCVGSSYATSVTANSATVYGFVTSLGAATSVTAGFVYGTTPAYGSTGSTTTILTSTGGAAGSFSATLSGLTCGTVYHYKPFATGTGTAYPLSPTTDETFTTLGTPSCTTGTTTTSGGIPTVTTLSTSTINTTSAMLNGTLNTLGAYPSATLGFTYGTVASGVYTTPVTSMSVPATSTTAGSGFQAALTGLTCGTQYKFVAKATTFAGVGFGLPSAFTTASCKVYPPTVSTVIISTAVINQTSVPLQGKIIATNGANATAAGFNITPAVPTYSPLTGVSLGVGYFSQTVTGLTCNTHYIVKAYATNSAGMGIDPGGLSFTTLACPLPAATKIVSIINGTTTVNLNGDITSTGSGGSINVGFQYGLATVPYTSSSISSVTFGPMTAVGPFTSHISALTCGTAYHARTWATNSAGTSYGPDYPFTTVACSTSVSTVGTTSITSTGATLKGTLNTLGTGVTSVTVGFQYGLSSTTLSTSSLVTTPISSPGAFSLVIPPAPVAFAHNMTYYYRAYAINSLGATVYAPTILSFTTLP